MLVLYLDTFLLEEPHVNAQYLAYFIIILYWQKGCNHWKMWGVWKVFFLLFYIFALHFGAISGSEMTLSTLNQGKIITLGLLWAIAFISSYSLVHQIYIL